MNEILQSESFILAMTPVLGAGLLVLGVWLLDVVTPGSLPDHFDNNMNAAVVAGARLVAVGAVVFAALFAADSGIVDAAALGFSGLVIHIAVSTVISYAYRGASDVVQKTGPLLPCAVLVASAQIPAALISIASIV